MQNLVVTSTVKKGDFRYLFDDFHSMILSMLEIFTKGIFNFTPYIKFSNDF